MNFTSIRRILGLVMKVEALFLLLPCMVDLIYGEGVIYAFLISAGLCLAAGLLLGIGKNDHQPYYAREGFIAVALAWILLSMFGALPFVISGDIPHYIDALFETVSGFTTTGASILSDVEALSHAGIFWRSFTHWVGGMGVMVFILAVMPMTGGYNMHLMRAESPGPSVEKMVPRLRDTAKILYLIYLVMTVIQIVLLLLAGMPLFDSLTLSFGTAGTGGFGIKNDSLGSYTMLQQGIITVFMILFGVNFNAYYYLLGKHKKNAFKMSEVQAYLAIIAFCIITITFNIRGQFENLFKAFHHAAFQVASIITTTGYSTIDFDRWPQYSRSLLVLIMFIGACAGSTGGGIKVSRILILLKSVHQELRHFVHPRSVTTIKMDGKTLNKETVSGVSFYLAAYFLIFAISFMIIALSETTSLETIFTAITATFNNIGPGLAGVGPTKNFGFFTDVSKIVMIFDMLAGRLELYPMLLLFLPSAWRKN